MSSCSSTGGDTSANINVCWETIPKGFRCGVANGDNKARSLSCVDTHIHVLCTYIHTYIHTYCVCKGRKEETSRFDNGFSRN